MTDSTQLLETRIAQADAERRDAWRVRYQVYCLEAGYFDPALYPDGLEQDSYDERSVQSVLYYRSTRVAVGAARLILPGADTDVVAHLPFDEVCDTLELYRSKRLPRESCAEISRFCVTRALREQAESVDSQLLRSIFRAAKLHLMRAVVAMTAASGVTHWCAVMEPALLQSFERLGLAFRHHGPVIQYHGLRQPVYADVDDLLRGVKQVRPDIWEAMTDAGALWP